jgi:hypothetical protein
MYRCELCKEVVPPHVESHRVVAETREVQYPFRKDANRPAPWKKNERRDDPGGRGREIAREVIACPRCAGKAE